MMKKSMFLGLVILGLWGGTCEGWAYENPKDTQETFSSQTAQFIQKLPTGVLYEITDQDGTWLGWISNRNLPEAYNFLKPKYYLFDIKKDEKISFSKNFVEPYPTYRISDFRICPGLPGVIETEGPQQIIRFVDGRFASLDSEVPKQKTGTLFHDIRINPQGKVCGGTEDDTEFYLPQPPEPLKTEQAKELFEKYTDVMGNIHNAKKTWNTLNNRLQVLPIRSDHFCKTKQNQEAVEEKISQMLAFQTQVLTEIKEANRLPLSFPENTQFWAEEPDIISPQKPIKQKSKVKPLIQFFNNLPSKNRLSFSQFLIH